MASYLEKSFRVLLDVIKGQKYVNLALNGLKNDRDKPITTKIVYGTIDKYYELNYVVKSLSDGSTKTDERLYLMQAIYCIKYLSVPNYAIVNESVAMATDFKINKHFVNAILNKVCNGEYPMPKSGTPEYLEYQYNLPIFIIDLVKRDYPESYDKILTAKGREDEHIRISERFKDNAEILEYFKDKEKTDTGYYSRINDEVKDFLSRGMATVQSYTSTLAVKVLGDIKNKVILDMCAAPGGKSVYMSELGAKVLSCDVTQSRIQLIKEYARRMNVGLIATLQDGTNYNYKLTKKFDIVVADVPCSGFGVLSKRQDIKFNRVANDVLTLSGVQYKILNNAKKYVKIGGLLLYSTCTITRDENEYLITEFLEDNPDFSLVEMDIGFENDGTAQFLPDDNGLDGFYICLMKRN